MRTNRLPSSSQIFFFLFLSCVSSLLYAQTEEQKKIAVQSSLAGGNVFFLYCVNGFGGGNVAASVGDDGILLMDDMYAATAPQLEATLKTLSTKPVRIVLNTHYHRDHIEGNSVWKKSAVIIAQENVSKQLIKNSKDMSVTKEMLPTVTFTDRMVVNFNGEDIQITHFANSHTDGDAMVYFTKSKVAHLGDMFFVGMFPAVYTQGGGDIRQLIVSLEQIEKELPADAKIIPGHGELSSVKDLNNYIAMLKESTRIVEAGMKQGKTVEQLQKEKVLAAYNALGDGGAQTTDQYLAMLYQLLSVEKK